MKTLKQKTISSMIWTVSEKFSIQILHLISSIILARLLEPSEFGLIGMLAIFTAVGQSILDSGFGSAIIRKQNANQVDFSSVFFINLITGLTLTILLFLAAPIIANFFNQPELIPLTRFLSFTFLINSFGFIQFTLFTKNLNFKKLFQVSLISVIISSSLGIIMALLNMGVWSLASQMICYSLCRVVMISLISRWKPTYVFSFSSIKEMFSFGSKILAFSLVEVIFNNIYHLIIGKIYTANELGFYSRAMTFQSAATQATSTSISRVIYPALSPHQNDNNKLKQAIKKTIMMSTFFHFPLMTGLIFVADPLLRFLLTDKWAPSIPYFQLLCVTGLLYPQRLLNLNIINLKGKSGINLTFILIEKLLIVFAILLTFRGGVISLLLGQLLVSILFFVISSFYVGQLISYSLFERFNDQVSIIFTSSLMGLIVFLIGEFVNYTNFWKLSFQIFSGFIVFVIINKIINSSELLEYQKIIKSIILQEIILIKKFFMQLKSKKRNL